MNKMYEPTKKDLKDWCNSSNDKLKPYSSIELNSRFHLGKSRIPHSLLLGEI